MTNREITTVPIQWIPSQFNFDNFVEAFYPGFFRQVILKLRYYSNCKYGGRCFKFQFYCFWIFQTEIQRKKHLVCTAFIYHDDSLYGIDDSAVLIWQSVGGYNTFLPLTVPCFFGSAFNVFLVKQFYSGIPKEYDEAAIVDGANYFTIYAKLFFPCRNRLFVR